jgi:imidazolonepropionase-like amidohydrolase
MDVIVSSTSLAATWIGLGDVTGTLAAGKSADLIAMPGDPVADIRAVAQTDLVVAQGCLVRVPEDIAAPTAAG